MGIQFLILLTTQELEISQSSKYVIIQIMKTIFSFCLIFFSFQTLVGQENKRNYTYNSKPSYHAPIGVMADHTHNKGEWMFSYRYMFMNMEGLKNGLNEVPFSDALESYMVSPERMRMNGHMLGLMFAPSNKLTLSLMAKYATNEMEHITQMGSHFATTSAEFGDTKFAALYRLIHRNKSKLHVELGLMIPSGSISSRDVVPASAPNEVILPYPMQIGTGTWDMTVGLTYFREFNHVNIGAQGRSLFRTGTNENDYRLGNKYEINIWSSFDVSPWLSISGRLEGISISKIEGSNPALNPQMVTTANTMNSGGDYVNLGVGFNILFPENFIRGLRFGAEIKHPVYQKLDGIQLKTNESLTMGVQYSL